jgi:hypothetical protein
MRRPVIATFVPFARRACVISNLIPLEPPFTRGRLASIFVRGCPHAAGEKLDGKSARLVSSSTTFLNS